MAWLNEEIVRIIQAVAFTILVPINIISLVDKIRKLVRRKQEKKNGGSFHQKLDKMNCKIDDLKGGGDCGWRQSTDIHKK